MEEFERSMFNAQVFSIRSKLMFINHQKNEEKINLPFDFSILNIISSCFKILTGFWLFIKNLCPKTYFDLKKRTNLDPISNKNKKNLDQKQKKINQIRDSYTFFIKKKKNNKQTMKGKINKFTMVYRKLETFFFFVLFVFPLNIFNFFYKKITYISKYLSILKNLMKKLRHKEDKGQRIKLNIILIFSPFLWIYYFVLDFYDFIKLNFKTIEIKHNFEKFKEKKRSKQKYFSTSLFLLESRMFLKYINLKINFPNKSNYLWIKKAYVLVKQIKRIKKHLNYSFFKVKKNGKLCFNKKSLDLKKNNNLFFIYLLLQKFQKLFDSDIFLKILEKIIGKLDLLKDDLNFLRFTNFLKILNLQDYLNYGPQGLDNSDMMIAFGLIFFFYSFSFRKRKGTFIDIGFVKRFLKRNLFNLDQISKLIFYDNNKIKRSLQDQSRYIDKKEIFNLQRLLKDMPDSDF